MIEALERLARAATPGPWEAHGGNVSAPESEDRLALDVRLFGGNREDHRKNAAYIAALSPDRVLRLLEVVKAANALLEPMDECREIARRWEPDDSSGKERQWLVRGRDAAKALRAALAGLEEGQ